MTLTVCFIIDKPQKPYNWHRTKYQERNRKRHRRKYQLRQQQRLRNRSSCSGTCRNMFSCMFSGQKVDWDKHSKCPGMMETCCTSWPRKKKYTKSGRSLGPFSPQVQVKTDSEKMRQISIILNQSESNSK